MNKYQYQILKYVHDQVTGEFVNIGLVLYSHESKYLKAKFISKYSRLSQFFIEVNGAYLMKLLRTLEKNINTSEETVFSHNSLDELTSLFLPKDDHCLRFSEVKSGIIPALKTDSDNVFDYKLENLYSRMISKYMEENIERKDDAYVWKKLYKQYFDECNITNKLKKHTVHTKSDDIQFDKSWKNGVWHCYQPLSFDLKNEKDIKKKAYEWKSIVQELDTSDEKIKLFLLASLPHDKPELAKFITDKIKETNLKKVEVNFIEETQAPALALSVKNEMEKSLV